MRVAWRKAPAQWRDRKCPMCGWNMVELFDMRRTFRGKLYHTMHCPCCLHRELAVEVLDKG